MSRFGLQVGPHRFFRPDRCVLLQSACATGGAVATSSTSYLLRLLAEAESAEYLRKFHER